MGDRHAPEWAIGMARITHFQPTSAQCPFVGFFQPVDNLPTLNVVNAGRAIPVKFGLGGDYGLSIFAARRDEMPDDSCDGGLYEYLRSD